MSKKVFKFLAAFFILGLVIFNLLFTYKLNFSVSRIKSQNTEIQNLTTQLKMLKNDFFPEEESSNSPQSLSQILTSTLEDYKLSEESENSIQEIKQFFNTKDTLSLPQPYKIQPTGLNGFQILSPQDKILLTASYDNLAQILTLETPEIYEQYNPYQYSSFQQEFNQQITQENLDTLQSQINQFTDFQANIQNIQSNSSYNNLLQQKQLQSIPPYYSDGKAYFNLLKDGEVMIQVTSSLSNPTYKVYDSIHNLVFQTISDSDLQTKLLQYIENETFQTLIEKNIQAKVNYIQAQLNTPEVLESLQQKDLSVSDPTDTQQTYQVSILNSSQDPVLTISIDKSTSQATLTYNDQSTPLDFKDLHFQPQQEAITENHLILGKHGSLTDTIIIANFNNQTQEVKLISLPRDLYIDNKKINSIYAYRGLETLVHEIEDLSGLNIDKYALVDMYTFIDVIDSLGGVTVDLDKPLVDPSYVTYDNDQWGTLKLEAGTHKVNGRQALRIARSRHSTSDFDRAHRQHLILKSLQKRISELGAKDAKTITEIALLGIDSTETNIDFQESLKYYSKFKDYAFSDSVVLSTANILQSSYTGSLNPSNPSSPTQAQNKGAYILLPKNNDWSLLRTFIYSFLSQ